ncbi:hypothetical protein BV20DRAFT_740495 [Pilatotrama ljubarskyi]|nr:hypothetical protein BV20DRAFT_740495 [Pilatotrama ljubarskyi]
MAPLAMSLPEELWDRIIDEYSPRDFEYRLYDSRDYRARSVLWACCLACRNWSPRSRLWLYYDVELQGHDRVCSFLRPIRENPFLAELVHRLTIHPKIAGRHRRSPTSYIPFAAIEMFKKLSKVQCLELVGLFWEDYPPMYYASIARFPITELTLSVSPATWTQVFRLVWALKERKSLHLQACSVSNPASLTASDLERISSLAERRPRCKALRRLIIQVPHRAIVLCSVAQLRVPDVSPVTIARITTSSLPTSRQDRHLAMPLWSSCCPGGDIPWEGLYCMKKFAVSLLVLKPSVRPPTARAHLANTFT